MSVKSMLVAGFVAGVLGTSVSWAQQAGGIRGKVTVEAAGSSVSGITVTAESEVMPKPRSAPVRSDGSYSLPLLLPGKYTLTFSNAQGVLQKLDIEVLLDQTSVADVALQSTRTEDLQTVRIVSSGLSRESNASLGNSLGSKSIESLPVGQTYRDLLKLVPGVQYSENSVLGPSAGGSGVDNKYGFDGVDVSLPLFGNLSAEPSTHDIANVSMERGGVKAIGFNRAGGFSINTTSKSGTNEFRGSVEYKVQPKSMVSKIRGISKYSLDQSWISAGFGGPIVEDSLFFYASYYRPEVTRDNSNTAYGAVKDYESIRNEYFGKLTWAPIEDVLLNLSLRTSEREGNGLGIGSLDADSVSTGDRSEQSILTFDGSWLVGDDTNVTFKVGKFELQTASLPDTTLSFVGKPGDRLNIGDLTNAGRFTVPTLLLSATTPAQILYNQQAQLLINQYGYINSAGVRAGGGRIGAAPDINDQDFYRDTMELAIDHKLEMGEATHELHAGIKFSEVSEELIRTTQGWGIIAYNGGTVNTTTTTPRVPYFYQATITESGAKDSAGNPLKPLIVSSSKSYNIELNDTIRWRDFDFNLGVLISKDELYGQGLRPKAGTVSGFETAPGNKYKMYTIDWEDMIQPRLGISWRYDGSNTVFANFASYNPEASSLARAASWDRNLFSRVLDIRFDQNGNFLESVYRGSSSGKVFVPNMKPRRVDEITLGTTRRINEGWALRGHVRYREGSHFWEDIWNFARSQEGTYGPNGGVPANLRALGDYVPNLAAIRAEIGGSSYVIAEVDGGYTKYIEGSIEAEWTGERTYLNASYVRSRYTGNFDQDNTTTVNDANTFIGSSFYNDARGQYVWDNKDGTLSGDRPHILKVFGYYTTDWKANVGAYFIFQSGQPWETWSSNYYGNGLANASAAISSFAEPAGSRRSASHWQLDLNYTQDFKFGSLPAMKLRADVFNVFDRQTGYNIQPVEFNALYGQPRSYFLPRRVQLSVKMEF